MSSVVLITFDRTRQTPARSDQIRSDLFAKEAIRFDPFDRFLL